MRSQIAILATLLVVACTALGTGCVDTSLPVLASESAAECSPAEEASTAATVRGRLAATLPEATAIDVRVRAGVVTLLGTVPDEYVRDRAEKESYAIAGVQRVENRLRIIAPPLNSRAM